MSDGDSDGALRRGERWANLDKSLGKKKRKNWQKVKFTDKAFLYLAHSLIIDP